MLDRSSPAAERGEVAGAAVSTDSGVGSAGRHWVVVVGIGGGVAGVETAEERVDRKQTLGWGDFVGKGLGMSRSVVLMGAGGTMMMLQQISMVM